MNKKRFMVLLLSGIMAAQLLCGSVYGGELSGQTETAVEEQDGLSAFTDGGGSLSAENLFSAGEEPLAKENPLSEKEQTPEEEIISDGDESIQENVEIDYVQYAYQPETDSYYVEYIDYIIGGSVSLR